MTNLDQLLRHAIHAYLESNRVSGRRFGKEALKDPGFVASLKHGRRLRLDTADTLLAHMGLEPIAPAFEREVKAFLDAGCAKPYVLGKEAANDRSFLARLHDEDSTFYLETVEAVHVWMWAHADDAAATAMGEAISDVPFLKDIGEEDGAGQKGGSGMGRNGGNPFMSCRKAGAYLGLSPRTLERMREEEIGPSYHRFGQRILYLKWDLDKWAATQRVDLDDPDDDRVDDPEDDDDRRKP